MVNILFRANWSYGHVRLFLVHTLTDTSNSYDYRVVSISIAVTVRILPKNDALFNFVLQFSVLKGKLIFAGLIIMIDKCMLSHSLV